MTVAESAVALVVAWGGMSPLESVELLLIGAVAGVMGGLLGIGGGLVMIPAMLLALGERFGANSFHLYKLASITTSFILAIPAGVRHARQGAMHSGMVLAAAPLSVLGAVAGVGMAMVFTGPQTHILSRVFGLFMILAAAFNAWQALARRNSSAARSAGDEEAAAEDSKGRVDAFGPSQKREVGASEEGSGIAPGSPPRSLPVGVRTLGRAAVQSPLVRGPASCPVPRRRRTLIALVIGLPSGLIAGLLGVAGGVWAVPAQNLIMGVNLRNAIANSTGIIVFTALATAIAKGYSVSHMDGVSPLDAWALTLYLAPGALVGGWIGADLTHRLPVGWLRVAVDLLLIATGVRLIQ